MARLVSDVHVRAEDGFNTAVFGPDDEVPEWAARQMGDHCFEDGDHPYPEQPAPEREAGSPPPKAGPGSGAAAWALYAAEEGVEIPEGAKRDEIIAVLEAAEVPVEQQ